MSVENNDRPFDIDDSGDSRVAVVPLAHHIVPHLKATQA
ncbi:hypothetical protein J2W49_002320 [Hydrogenophaga palleronii]|uniref:Uncharacterized protein n=1 Tax=Hydrogenophaga palleronii TaxID=65655 RepID=A0ABU1WN61_9BURK|nr:hypothetical protein [Hydrogenophaga palleronii]